MKRLSFLLIIALVFTKADAQFINKIKADSVLITNDSCTAELNLENSTKHIKGFLYNKGNGRTEFRKAVVLNDSTFVFGDDTLVIRGSGGGAWKLTGNAGTDTTINFLGTADNTGLNIRTNNTSRVKISGKGNIDMAASDSISLMTDTIRMKGAANYTNGPSTFYHLLRIKRTNAGGFPDITFVNHRNNRVGVVGSRNSDNEVYVIADSADYVIRTGTTPGPVRLIVKNNGLVGIGTSFTTPVFRLHVNGSIGANKDSITRQTIIGSRQVLTIDTATGKFEKIPYFVATGELVVVSNSDHTITPTQSTIRYNSDATATHTITLPGAAVFPHRELKFYFFITGTASVNLTSASNIILNALTGSTTQNFTSTRSGGYIFKSDGTSWWQVN